MTTVLVLMCWGSSITYPAGNMWLFRAGQSFLYLFKVDINYYILMCKYTC